MKVVFIGAGRLVHFSTRGRVPHPSRQHVDIKLPEGAEKDVLVEDNTLKSNSMASVTPGVEK